MDASDERRNTPDSKVHGANMGPIWSQQDPGGPHVGPMNFAIWDRQLSGTVNVGSSSRYGENISFLGLVGVE